MSVLRTVLGVPFTTRARNEFLFCLLAALTAESVEYRAAATTTGRDQ